VKYLDKLRARYRYSTILLRELVVTDFKLRYQGSTLGYLWSLLRPLLLFLIMYVVFVKFLKVGDSVPHYPVYLLLGIVLWNFFGEITGGSIGSVVGKGDLLRKINFPRYVIVLAGSFSALINLLLNFAVIIVFMFFSHIDFRWGMLYAVPLIAELFLFAMSIGFFLSALFVRFRDVTYIWDVFMQGAFYATPIFYSLSKVPIKAQYIIVLSPVAQVIQQVRHTLITNQTLTTGEVYRSHPWAAIIPLSLVAILAVVGMLYFRSRSKYFAEEI
jgi:ABC-2 type transport system permease protein